MNPRDALAESGLLEEIRAVMGRGEVGAARLRLLAHGIPSWQDARGRLCVSLTSTAGLLGLNRSTVLELVRAGRLPATEGLKEHRQYRGQRPWLIPLVHIVAYRVDPARQALGRLGGLATAAKLRALRARRERRRT